MITYHGHRQAQDGRCIVTRLDSRKQTSAGLDPRLDLERFSYGFDWGHGGPGADQLALAILADAMGDEVAQKLHQGFKWVFLASLVGQHFQSWEITRDRVRRWVRERPTKRSVRL